VLSHAPRSRFIDPGRPPAADGGLRSQYPDLVLGAQQPHDCRQLRQAGRRVLTRSFDTRSKASIDLAALAIKPGSSEPQLTTSGRATYTIRFPLTKSQQNVTGVAAFVPLPVSAQARVRVGCAWQRSYRVISNLSRYDLV